MERTRIICLPHPSRGTRRFTVKVGIPSIILIVLILSLLPITRASYTLTHQFFMVILLFWIYIGCSAIVAWECVYLFLLLAINNLIQLFFHLSLKPNSKDSGRVQQIVEGMRNEPKLDEDVGTGQTKEKLTKAERRKELKQVKRQAKKQAKEQSQNDKLSKAPKSAVLVFNFTFE
eukprot:Gb_30923 [translate_table: standard]